MPSKMAAQTDAPTLAKATKEIESRYSRDIWLIKHREGFKKAGIAALIAVETLLVLYGIWAFADYYLIRYVDEQKMISSFLNGDALSSSVREQAPSEIAFREPTVLSTGAAFDILAFAKNSNPNFIAEITYHFQIAGKATDKTSVLLLQDSEMPLTAFGIEGDRPRNAELVVDEIEWSRINPKQIPYPVAWKNDRLGFVEKNVLHDPTFKISDKTVGRTTFVFSNPTGYGYREVGLVIVLKRGGAVVGVNRTIVSNINPLEEKFVQVDWFGGAPAANQVDIYPIVDLFDRESYLETSFETPKDRRDLLERRR